MVKIRLKKLGRKKAHFYRIIAIDSKKRRNGAALAELGWYDPIKKRSQIDRERTLFYIKQGAQPTSTIANLFQKVALL